MESPERIVCPLCGASLKAKTLPAPGAKVKCPKCSGDFRYLENVPPDSVEVDLIQPEHVPPPFPSPASLEINVPQIVVPKISTPKINVPKIAIAKDNHPQSVMDKGRRKKPSQALLIAGSLAAFVVVLGLIAFVASQFNGQAPAIAKADVSSRTPKSKKDVTGAANPSQSSEVSSNVDIPETTEPPEPEIKDESIEIAPLKSLALKSVVRDVLFVKNDQTVAISLVPNAVDTDSADFKSAYKKLEAEFAIGERECAEMVKNFELENARILEREKSRRLKNPQSLGEERAPREGTEAQRMASYIKSRRESIGRRLQSRLEHEYQRLKQQCASQLPWGEMAALWTFANAQPDEIITQPDFDEHEFHLDKKDPSKVTLPSLPDPASPVGVSRYTDVPHALLSNARIAWCDRYRGPAFVEFVGSRPPIRNEFELQVRHWLVSPDGNYLFYKGTRQSQRTVTDPDGPGTPLRLEYFTHNNCALLMLSINAERYPEVDRLSPTALEACFTPDSKRLVLLHLDDAQGSELSPRSIVQFNPEDLNDIKKPITLPIRGAIKSMVVAPDCNRLIVVGGEPSRLHSFDLGSGQEHAIDAPEQVAMPVFSPDGKTLAVVAKHPIEPKQEVLLIDVVEGKVRKKIPHWSAYVHALAFSPDSQTLGIAGGSEAIAYRPAGSMHHQSGKATGQLKLFNADTGAPLARLTGHTDQVNCLAFTKDGERLVSGSMDRTVKIWDISPLRAPNAQ